MNSFGNKLRLTTFGESHGPAVGGIIDGFPSGFRVDFEHLASEINARRPGASKLVSQREEDDIPEFLSGITKDGITLGTPIGFIIRNKGHKNSDYDNIKDKFRPNHADYTYFKKYGIRASYGGGRASARETLNWVVAGALAQQWLKSQNIEVRALMTGAGSCDFSDIIKKSLIESPFSDNFHLDDSQKELLDSIILQAKNKGDSIGGKITGLVTGLKAGIGDPVFRKLQANLAYAMLSINAVKSFEYGIGQDALNYTGSESADIFILDGKGLVSTATNFSGGIQGGISNGMPVFFSVTFKPSPSICQSLPTIDYEGNQTFIKVSGRHDSCVVLRAVPVVRAMTALVITDYLL